MHDSNPHAHTTESGFIRYDVTDTWNPDSDDTTVCNFIEHLSHEPLDIESDLYDFEVECMVGTLFLNYAGCQVWCTPNWRETSDDENKGPGISFAIEAGDWDDFAILDQRYIEVDFTGDVQEDDVTFRTVVVEYIADHSDLFDA